MTKRYEVFLRRAARRTSPTKKMLRIWFETDIAFATIRFPTPVQRNRLPEPEHFLWGHVRIDPLRPKIEATKQLGVQPATIVARLIASADSCRETETTIRVLEGLGDIKPGRLGASENVWNLGDGWSPSTIGGVPNRALGCGSDGSGDRNWKCRDPTRQTHCEPASN